MGAAGTRASKILAIVGMVAAVSFSAVVHRNHGRLLAPATGAQADQAELREQVLRLPSLSFSGGIRRASWDLEEGAAASPAPASAPSPLPSPPPTNGLEIGVVGR